MQNPGLAMHAKKFQGQELSFWSHTAIMEKVFLSETFQNEIIKYMKMRKANRNAKKREYVTIWINENENQLHEISLTKIPLPSMRKKLIYAATKALSCIRRGLLDLSA